MATVAYRIARGYTPQIKAYQEASPWLTPIEGTHQWAQERIGTWIATNLQCECSIRVEATGVVLVELPNEETAQRFVSEMGGVVMPEEEQ